MIAALSSLLMILGAVLLVVAAWGVIRLPDALARQHAATKAATLAVAVFALGVLVATPAIEWVWRLLVLVGFLLATLPVASHLLARAAMREMRQQDEAAHAPLIGGEGDRPRPSPQAHSP